MNRAVIIAGVLVCANFTALSAGSRDPVEQQGEHAAESLAFQINRGAVFSEDEAISTQLAESVSNLIRAIRSGEITNEHIAEDDQQQYSFFMGALRRLQSDSELPASSALILKSFSPDADESFLITVAFMSSMEDGNQIEKIVEFHAYPHDDGYRFRSPFEYRTRALKTRAMDGVRYHYAYAFDHTRAEQFVAFKEGFEQRLGNPPSELEYFCFETLDELLRAYGIVYDCTRCNWLKEDLGFMDNDGRMFITGTGNERFIFDYLVDYMSMYCDEEGDLYPPFVYGMAAYYGGYGLGGDDIETLKAQFRAEFAARPDINFLEEFRKGRKSSIERHFSYFVICAFLCEEAIDQHGFDAALQLAHSGRSEEGFFENIAAVLDIDERNFHDRVAELIQSED